MAHKYTSMRRPQFGRRVRPYSSDEPGTLASLRSGSRAEPCRQLSRRLAAVLTSLPCAVARPRTSTAFQPPPVPLRRPRAGRRTVSPARRAARTQGARASGNASRRMPGVRAHLILGAVQSGPDGPVSVTAVEGGPETSDGSWPFRWLETSHWSGRRESNPRRPPPRRARSRYAAIGDHLRQRCDRSQAAQRSRA
jgi:hypothetical protein